MDIVKKISWTTYLLNPPVRAEHTTKGGILCFYKFWSKNTKWYFWQKVMPPPICGPYHPKLPLLLRLVASRLSLLWYKLSTPGSSSLNTSVESDELQSTLGSRLVGHTAHVESIHFSRYGHNIWKTDISGWPLVYISPLKRSPFPSHTDRVTHSLPLLSGGHDFPRRPMRAHCPGGGGGQAGQTWFFTVKTGNNNFSEISCICV